MAATTTVLLLNPPGDKIYIRDYYCSKVSKAHYIYPPVDLLIQSGILSTRGPVEVLDAIVERMRPRRCMERILSRDYGAIVFLAGSVSYRGDFAFMRELRARRPCTFVGIGDVFMEGSAALLGQEGWLDAVCLDFTSTDLRTYLDDPAGAPPLDGMAFKQGGGVVGGIVRRARGQFEIPVPRHELFRNRKYTYPFIRRSPFATVLTDYGCPYRCSFCIMAQLGYKTRTVPNVIAELEYITSLGIREVYFSDQTFGADRARARELLGEMLRRRLGISWVCFSRVDLVNEETLPLMKEAGCHTIMFGVESGNARVLEGSGKGTSPEMVRRAFDLCRKTGMTTVGTFILGLPDDTEESIRQTIEFAKEIRCNYAAFNVPVPRMLTPLRHWALDLKMIPQGLREMDQSGTYASMDTRHLSRRKIMELKREAIIKFYLRPSYLLQRLFAIKSLYDLKSHVLGFFSIVKNAFTRR